MTRTRRKPPKRRPLSVLLDDDPWLAINKPAGIAVHSGAGKTTSPSVLERLFDELGQKLHLVHRLDRGTAGVLLLARSPEAARRGSETWPKVRKTYWAVVKGIAAPQQLHTPLRTPDGRMQPATTIVEWTMPLRFTSHLLASVCRISITTGRLHQIRRHLAEVGHPVLMDDRYGDFSTNKSFQQVIHTAGQTRPKHLCLLCSRLAAPSTSDLPHELAAPLPSTWERWLQVASVSVDDLDGLA